MLLARFLFISILDIYNLKVVHKKLFIHCDFSRLLLKQVIVFLAYRWLCYISTRRNLSQSLVIITVIANTSIWYYCLWQKTKSEKQTTIDVVEVVKLQLLCSAQLPTEEATNQGFTDRTGTETRPICPRTFVMAKRLKSCLPQL